MYSILISKKTATSQQYFNSLFPDSNLDLKLIYQGSQHPWIYLLPREISRSSSCRAFQYKILNNALYLNKMLFRFGKTHIPLCSFCKLHGKTLTHLFISCNQVISLWIEIKLFYRFFFLLLFYVFIYLLFLPDRCSLKIVVPRFKNIFLKENTIYNFSRILEKYLRRSFP